MTSLQELAFALGLECGEAWAAFQIQRVSAIPSAAPNSIVFAEDEASLNAALASQCAAVLSRPEIAKPMQTQTQKCILLSKHPRLDFARAARLLDTRVRPAGIHPQAAVDASAIVAFTAFVGAGAVIGKEARVGEQTLIGEGAIIGERVTIGSYCRIYAHVVIYPETILGAYVVVHAGSVLGADGFGYVRDPATGEYLQFPQQGTLVIEDEVEIGANTTIDRGALAETRICRGAKLDNLVHIGHNVEVGRNVVIAAQAGISGSSTVGDGAVLGGQVGIGDHASVGEGVILGGQAGVLPHKQLRGAGVAFWGTPAKPLRQYLRELASLAKRRR